MTYGPIYVYNGPYPFYLTFVDPIKTDIIQGTDDNYWHKKHGSHQWSTWAGYAFETICLKHIRAIKRALGIAAINTTQAQWLYIPKDPEDQGAQIDLLIDRADNCINLCEIKFCNDEYVITKDYAQQLEQKRQVFIRQTKTKKAIFITMITPHGVKKNQYYTQVVDQELTLDALFT